MNKKKIDCGCKWCSNYNHECFFREVLVKQPDPKIGCSYARKMKKQDKKKEDIVDQTTDKRKRKIKKFTKE